MNKEKIVYKKVSELKLNPKNPRKNDNAVDTVAKSIQEFGFKNPLIIDSNGIVWCGNTRLKASRKLGIEEVPCIVADDLTEEQIREYALLDNKTNEIAEWDLDLLSKELADLDLSDFELDWGIEELEPEKEFEEDDFDVDSAIPEKPKSKPGDIYQLGEHRLMCGDSTKQEDVAKLIGEDIVGLVVTDPPYGIDVVGDDGKVGANFGVAKKGNYSKIIADNTTDTARLSYNILKAICNKMILWGGNYFIDFLDPSDSWIIWDKRVDSGIRNTFADGEMAYCSFHTPIRIYHQLWNGMIREGEKDKRVHPTQKPIKILSEIIADFSKEKELILDLFGGSGSTLIACEQLNRKCYMMELDPKYVDVIIKRWEDFTGRKAIKIN